MLHELNPSNAWIFRITHIRNVSWILANGLHCRNSGRTDPEFVTIGMPDIIALRDTRTVPVPPHGTLSDYIPFYFTPKSPMLYNIVTGWGSIPQRSNSDHRDHGVFVAIPRRCRDRRSLHRPARVPQHGEILFLPGPPRPNRLGATTTARLQPRRRRSRKDGEISG